MKILDFSTAKFDELDLTLSWEKEIAAFLNDWTSDLDSISCTTSGSTGKPKKINLPKESMRKSARMTATFFSLSKGETALLCLPVNFIAGKMMLVRAIELKLKLYITKPTSHISLEGLDLVDFVPMTPMQVESSFDQISQIKNLLIGGAPLANALRKRLFDLPTNCYESYGMTETITHIALKKISEEVFTALPGVCFRADERACLVIRTPFFNEEIITNDLVELQNETQFKFLGRVDNVINSAGVKLFPEQIEAKLDSYFSHKFIVSSLPDKVLGEKLVLIMESDQPIEIDFEQIKLEKFERPKTVLYLAEFPRTKSGKIDRPAIKKLIVGDRQI